ncbi:MAG: glutathione synthase [Candidatus Azotimanducaceae bacterium]|jgi:glutathione synthase
MLSGRAQGKLATHCHHQQRHHRYPMLHIILLIADTDLIEDTNYLRLGNELLQRDVAVDCCFMDSLAMHNSEIVADGFPLVEVLKADQPFPPRARIHLSQADIVWTLTLGMRHSFLDKIQLLKCLDGQCKMINSLDALMHFKSKYFLASHRHIFQYPDSYGSTSSVDLLTVMKQAGGRWIAKPPAGSLGRDIFLLTSEDRNARVILESMTGPESDQYCLIQPYVEEIAQGEKRVLIANGQPVAQYLRQSNGDHRTNVSAGASTTLCDLTADEHQYCERIGAFLAGQGAQFVGLDLAYPWVIEFNVVNPGGIQTIVSLGGVDPSKRIIDEIFRDYVPTA